MRYTCTRCSRVMEWNEELSFCPFCGNAYQAIAQVSAAMKIVIGSDSEKTIQEKYWNRTRTALNDTLNGLKASLPRFSQIRDDEALKEKKAPKQYQTHSLKIEELSELEHCTSMADFRTRMESIFEKVEQEYRVNYALTELGKKYIEEDRKISAGRKIAMEHGEWSVEELEDEYSIDIEEEEAFIQQFCAEIAENLGNMSPNRLRPELDYDPNSTDWMKDEEDEEDFDLFAEYASLWKEIRDSSAAMISALESNGLFALTLVHGECSDDFEPKPCAQDLRKMKVLDYDPLFGESPEHFIRTFFDGLANLMDYINHLPDYARIMEMSPEQKLHNLKNELDEIKLEALEDLVRRWSKILVLELDRLYQSQREDMMDVCNEIETLRKSLDEKK